MQRMLVLIVCSTVVLTLRSTCHAVDFAWWVDWSMRPSGTEVEGVPVSALNPNWRHASVIRESDLPAASRQPGERPEDNGAVFSVDIDLDGDRHDEKAVVGVYETAQGKISVNDPNPFSAIRMVQGTLHWVGCFECDDDCTVIRSKSGLFQLHC
jgi:hypothetical protein